MRIGFVWDDRSSGMGEGMKMRVKPRRALEDVYGGLRYRKVGGGRGWRAGSGEG